jgi:hypothetical protein
MVASYRRLDPVGAAAGRWHCRFTRPDPAGRSKTAHYDTTRRCDPAEFVG